MQTEAEMACAQFSFIIDEGSSFETCLHYCIPVTDTAGIVHWYVHPGWCKTVYNIWTQLGDVWIQNKMLGWSLRAWLILKLKLPGIKSYWVQWWNKCSPQLFLKEKPQVQASGETNTPNHNKPVKNKLNQNLNPPICVTGKWMLDNLMDSRTGVMAVLETPSIRWEIMVGTIFRGAQRSGLMANPWQKEELRNKPCLCVFLGTDYMSSL